MSTAAHEWRARLRAELTAAMRARESARVGVLRSLLGAIDNAEAADASAAPEVQTGVIAGGVPGAGAGEVARRVLDTPALVAVLDAEVASRTSAAHEFDVAGRADRADSLRAEIDVLVSLRHALPT